MSNLYEYDCYEAYRNFDLTATPELLQQARLTSHWGLLAYCIVRIGGGTPKEVEICSEMLRKSRPEDLLQLEERHASH